MMFPESPSMIHRENRKATSGLYDLRSRYPTELLPSGCGWIARPAQEQVSCRRYRVLSGRDLLTLSALQRPRRTRPMSHAADAADCPRGHDTTGAIVLRVQNKSAPTCPEFS